MGKIGKRRKLRKLRAQEQAVIAAKEGKAEIIGEAGVRTTDHAVPRKPLQKPRYFDPPGSSLHTCYSCGEEGHLGVNCTSLKQKKKKKPCFVCGSLAHSGNQCLQARGCYIYKKGDLRAKYRPKKEKLGLESCRICLKCGQSGHEMFSCKNDYPPSDLNEIQCYFCRSFGHLCCVDFVDTNSSKVSCYRCGQAGHTGLACSKARSGNQGERKPSSCHRCGEEGHLSMECKNSTMGEVTSSSCYRCGEEHFARECKSLIKYAVHCNNHLLLMCNGNEGEAVMPKSCYKCGGDGHFAYECENTAKEHKRKQHDEEEEHKGIKSEANTFRANKRKKQGKDKKITTPQKPRSGGSIWMDPREKSFRESNNGWRSPTQPSCTGHMIKADPGEKSFRESNNNGWRSPTQPSCTGHMIKADPGEKSFRESNNSRRSPTQPSCTGHMIKADPGEKSFRESNKNGWRSPTEPSYTGHMVTRVSPGDQMYNYQYSGHMVTDGTRHHYSYNSQYGGQVYNPQYPTGQIYQPQSSYSPHMFQYGASAYQGLPNYYPHPYTSSNPHMFQYGDPAYWGSPNAPQPGFSASTFWNPGSDWSGRNYGW